MPVKYFENNVIGSRWYPYKKRYEDTRYIGISLSITGRKHSRKAYTLDIYLFFGVAVLFWHKNGLG